MPEPEYQEGQEDDPARDMFTDNGKLNSGRAQYLDDLMEAAALYASGELDDPDARLDEASLARIGNPALRAKLQGKIAQARQAGELRAHELVMRQQAWDRGDVICQIGGTKLNSRQIDNILKMMADPKRKAELVEKFSKKEGISKPEAEGKLDQAARTLEVVKKKERDPNAVLTPQEQEDYDRRNDPKLAPAITFLEKERQGSEKEFDARHTRLSNRNETNTLASATATREEEPAIKTDIPLDSAFKKAANTENIKGEETEPEAKPTTSLATAQPTAAKVAAAGWM